MDLVDFGIIILAALMVWLFHKATQETRAYGAERRKYTLRQARTRDSGNEYIGGQRTRR
jgi:hypothetical protein